MNLRQQAKGRPCMIRVPHVCNGNPETTVLCHLRMAGISGMGLKANDILGAWGCSACHRYVDTHGIDGRTALLEGIARTQGVLIREGYLRAVDPEFDPLPEADVPVSLHNNGERG